ncbi:MAG: hypothetical protein HY530_06880 [Chloroflexi bacterium]|nr:hypothetical protein [Chloroflexota bacterium]
MAKYVSPELYNKYARQILEMGLAIQCYEGTTAVRETSSLSDQEIADRLGLDVEDVTEIRCIAEIDLLPADAWLESDNWKREKARKHFKKG